MVFIINTSNWCGAIGEAIRRSNDGDTIVVDSALKAKLAEKALKTQCPYKRLNIEVGAVARPALATA